MKRIIASKAAPAIGPYSHACISGNLVFTSGQLAISENGEWLGGTAEEQTHIVMKNLQIVLETAGSSLDKIIKTTIFIKNMEDFADINIAYASYFKSFPARSCIEVARLPKDALVEIEAIAEI